MVLAATQEVNPAGMEGLLEDRTSVEMLGVDALRTMNPKVNEMYLHGMDSSLKFIGNKSFADKFKGRGNSEAFDNSERTLCIDVPGYMPHHAHMQHTFFGRASDIISECDYAAVFPNIPSPQTVQGIMDMSEDERYELIGQSALMARKDYIDSLASFLLIKGSEYKELNFAATSLGGAFLTDVFRKMDNIDEYKSNIVKAKIGNVLFINAFTDKMEIVEEKLGGELADYEWERIHDKPRYEKVYPQDFEEWQQLVEWLIKFALPINMERKRERAVSLSDSKITYMSTSLTQPNGEFNVQPDVDTILRAIDDEGGFGVFDEVDNVCHGLRAYPNNEVQFVPINPVGKRSIHAHFLKDEDAIKMYGMQYAHDMFGIE